MTPEELCRRFAGEIRQALRAAGRHSLRCAVAVDGLRLTFGAKEAASKTEATGDVADLPEGLHDARPSTHRVYRVLRQLRRELGPEARVTPTRIARRIEEEGDIPSVDTINHALRDLRNRGLARSHPRLGWLLDRDPAEGGA